MSTTATKREVGEADHPLVDHFEKSASAVRDTFGRFEEHIARPLIDYMLQSFQTHPVRSTFAAFYLTFGALPVLSFIGISIFILATFVFLGLATAIFFATWAIGFFGFWLACALVFFFFLSLNLTTITLATYVLICFVLRARQDGPGAAFSALAGEARSQFAVVRGRKSTVKSLQPERDATKKADEEGSEGESPVMIGSSTDVGNTESPTSVLGEKVPGVPVDAPSH